MGPVMLLLIAALHAVADDRARAELDLQRRGQLHPPDQHFVMMSRLASDSPPPAWQVWLTVLIGLGAAYAAVWFAAKIFKIGLLMHGKPPNFATLDPLGAAGVDEQQLPTSNSQLPKERGVGSWELAVGSCHASGSARPATTTRSGRGASIRRSCRRRRCCRTTPSGFRPSRSTTRSIGRRPRRSSTGWNAATPDGFKLTLKAPKRITHDARLRDCGDRVRQFLETAAMLGPKLGALLFQLPPNLKKDVALLDAFLDAFPPRVCAAFEFRHASWLDDEVYGAAARAEPGALRRRQREAVDAGRDHGGLRLFPAARRGLHAGRHRPLGRRDSREDLRLPRRVRLLQARRSRERAGVRAPAADAAARSSLTRAARDEPDDFALRPIPVVAVCCRLDERAVAAVPRHDARVICGLPRDRRVAERAGRERTGRPRRSGSAPARGCAR